MRTAYSFLSLLIFLLILTLVNSCSSKKDNGITPSEPNAPSKWVWQNPRPVGNDLHTVWFSDQNNGIAAGAGGTVIRTTDGGLSWSVQTLPGNDNITSVMLFAGSTGWAVGSEGAIFKTTDGGQIWLRQTPDVDIPFTDVFAYSNQVGFTVGGNQVLGTAVVGTVNGGTDWTTLDFDKTDIYYGVHFLTNSIGCIAGHDIASGNGFVLRTTDGGQNWNPTAFDVTPGPLLQIDFADATNGWATGVNGAIAHTTNAGQLWTVEQSGTDKVLSGLSVVSENVAFAAAANPGAQAQAKGDRASRALQEGKVLRTTNKGVNWELLDVGTVDNIIDVNFINENTGWAVGQDGIIAGTSDGGTSWSILSTGSEYEIESFRDIVFVSADSGYALGNASPVIVRTTDGGENWEEIDQTPPGFFSEALEFINGLTGWTGNIFGSIYKTTDGGENWDLQVSLPGFSINDIDFVDPLIGWAVGNNGDVRRSTDGGASWTELDPGTGQEIHAVNFLSSTTGWLVGAGGVIRKTTDGGDTWQPQNSLTGSELRGVVFVDDQVGYAVGNNGTIIKTTDGGAVWEQQSTTASSNLYDVAFADASTGWICGDNGTILFTSDGGAQWDTQPSRTTNRLYKLALIDIAHVWTAGENAAILHAVQ
jgi:photosystem II stability/assembly factor-like uncharacterized protein